MTKLMKKIDFAKYSEFVDAVTSDESKDFVALSDRLVSLDEKGANIERLMTYLSSLLIRCDKKEG